jgi:Toprim-like
MTSLAEAITYGEGIERPFQCPEHEDHQASASVNVVKGVWFCYACGAKGAAEGRKVPKVADLQAMLEPTPTCRIYPETYLELFENYEGNFAHRFSDQALWALRLGCDPLTGDATFPVRTAAGALAGVGRRRAMDGEGPRFLYPPRWAASRSFFEARHRGDQCFVLVEGATDASACFEVGFSALACYGAGIHMPQLERLRQLNPKLVVLGFDADNAGELAVGRAYDALAEQTRLLRIDWQLFGVKDAAELDPEARHQALLQTVAAADYGPFHDPDTSPAARREALVTRYTNRLDEER